MAGWELARSSLPRESKLTSVCLLSAMAFVEREGPRGQDAHKSHCGPPHLVEKSNSKLLWKVCCLLVKQGLMVEECCPWHLMLSSPWAFPMSCIMSFIGLTSSLLTPAPALK